MPRLHAPLILRLSLLARLDEGLDRKLTLLSAPAGFGKTTLVSQWFVTRWQGQASLPRAWVTLDAGDNDPVRFWRYVFSACQAFDAGLGHSALALLQTPQPAFEAALTLFINELAQLSGRHILVLEDYHLIASPQIHEIVRFLLDHLPDSLHLMILTRQDPPLPLARLRTRHELNEIGAADLRFSLAETKLLLQQALPTPISADDIARLDARTEGWIAALRLVILALQGRHDPKEIKYFLAGFSGGHGHILEYLVEEVLNAQPEPIQQFLLQTTFLNRLTGSLCDAVTGRNDSARLLEKMERANLFLISLDGAQKWYRYHGLFAEAMHHYAHNRLDKATLYALYARASTWFEAHGLLSEAFETSFATQAYERAANLLEQIVAPQLVQNQFHTLRRWMEQLPEDVMRSHPQLCMTFAIAILFTSDRYAPTTHVLLQPPLAMAEEVWRAEGKQHKLGQLMAFRSLVAWFQPNLIEAFAAAREALALLPADDAQWRGISLIFVGLEEMLNGHLYAARQELLKSLELNRGANNIYGTLDTLLLLGRVCAEQGELRQSAHYHQQVLVEVEQRPMDREMAQIRRGRALAGLSRLELEWNRLETAEHFASQALDVAHAYAEEELRVQSTLLLVLIEQAHGHHTQAKERLHALIAQTKQPHLLREIDTAQAQLALATGDLATARRWSTTPASHFLPLIQEEAEILISANLQLAQGQADAALDLIRHWQDAAHAEGRTHAELEMLVITALAAYTRKATDHAKQALLQALTVAQPEGFQRIFLDAGEPMADLLRGLLRELKEEPLVAYIRDLLLAFVKEKAEKKAGEQDAPSLDAALLIEPLSTQERRVLRLLAADLSNPEIAEQLVVSLNTVKTHVKNIYSKLDVHSREEAGDVARQLNLV
jgi:LuxR family maltose regulon positive regulatory protein